MADLFRHWDLPSLALGYARAPFDWRIKDAPLRMTPLCLFDWRLPCILR
jgi:hypothetical protein